MGAGAGRRAAEGAGAARLGCRLRAAPGQLERSMMQHRITGWCSHGHTAMVGQRRSPPRWKMRTRHHKRTVVGARRLAHDVQVHHIAILAKHGAQSVICHVHRHLRGSREVGVMSARQSGACMMERVGENGCAACREGCLRACGCVDRCAPWGQGPSDPQAPPRITGDSATHGVVDQPATHRVRFSNMAGGGRSTQAAARHAHMHSMQRTQR